MASVTMESPVGPLFLEARDGDLRRLEFRRGSSPGPREWASCDDRDRAVLEQARTELERYFRGDLTVFTVPVRLDGPSFHREVWGILKTIPFGQALTYSQVAEKLGSPRGARAVGNACARNPVAIIVPCHRVLARSGLGGFGGGLDAKKWLLRHERYQLRLEDPT